jgi:hypothetical protein
MSSGLELIPLGIALVGMLSQSARARYNDLENNQVSAEASATLPTRMVDPHILDDTLGGLPFTVEKTPTGLSIALSTGVLHLDLSTGGNFHATFNRETAEEALDALQQMESRYSQLFQRSLAEQFLSNAQTAGMPIQQVDSNDGVIRLRVTVS